MSIDSSTSVSRSFIEKGYCPKANKAPCSFSTLVKAVALAALFLPSTQGQNPQASMPNPQIPLLSCQPHTYTGWGRMSCNNHTVFYQGWWNEGKLIKGMMKMPFGSSSKIYEGENWEKKWEDMYSAMFPNGQGKIIYAGDVFQEHSYEGELKGECPHGFGEMTYVKGNIYRGNWVKCYREGEGVYSEKVVVDQLINKVTKEKEKIEYQVEKIYDGQWRRDHRVGLGIELEFFKGYLLFCKQNWTGYSFWKENEGKCTTQKLINFILDRKPYNETKSITPIKLVTSLSQINRLYTVVSTIFSLALRILL